MADAMRAKYPELDAAYTNSVGLRADDQLRRAFENGFSPVYDSSIATGRFPQISGSRATFTCSGTTPRVTGMWQTPQGLGGLQTPIAAGDTVRIVTNDFMYTGGNGYTVFAEGTDVQQPGDDLMQIAVDHVRANSLVNPVVEEEGRIPLE